jgi:hypothetical protein
MSACLRINDSTRKRLRKGEGRGQREGRQGAGTAERMHTFWSPSEREISKALEK